MFLNPLKRSILIFGLISLTLIPNILTQNDPFSSTTEATSSSVSTTSSTTLTSPQSQNPTSPASITSATSTPPPLRFELNEYNILVHENQIGEIYQFRTNPPIPNTIFELEYTDPTSKIDLSNTLDLELATGILKLKRTLAPGRYTFTIKATTVSSPNTKSSTSAKVTLDADGFVQCKQTEEPQFTYSFLKKHIQENNDTIILPENKMLNCEYFIENQNPPGDFVSVDRITGKLVSSVKVDREAKEFKDQAQPHISLDLLITCHNRKKRSVKAEMHSEQTFPSSSSNNNNNRVKRFFRNPLGRVRELMLGTESSEETKEYKTCSTLSSRAACETIIDNTIEFNTQKQRLLLIVDDENDNAPQFQNEQYFFAYPEKQFFHEIIPASIGQVQASDKDEGLNAIVQYKLVDPSATSGKQSELVIDPCTGELYPHYAHFEYNPINFQVIATDRNGSQDGLSSTVNVTLDIVYGHQLVKLLIKKHIEMSNKQILMQIGNAIHANVSTLKMATVPSMYELAQSQEINSHSYHILQYFLIYAYRDNELLDMNKVVGRIKQNKDLNERLLWVHVLSETPIDYVQSKSFFSSMVVLFLAISLSCLAFYIMYIRTGNYYKCIKCCHLFKKNSSTSSTTSPLDGNEDGMGTSEYVVSFARMNHTNPTFDVADAETEDVNAKSTFTSITLKAFEPPTLPASSQMDELTPAPTILVNSNTNSRRNSAIVDDLLGLPEEITTTRTGRRKSTVSFNEIVEQYHRVN